MYDPRDYEDYEDGWDICPLCCDDVKTAGGAMCRACEAEWQRADRAALDAELRDYLAAQAARA